MFGFFGFFWGFFPRDFGHSNLVQLGRMFLKNVGLDLCIHLDKFIFIELTI